MINPTTTTIYTILERLSKYGINPNEIDLYEVAEHIGSAISLIGSPLPYKNKVTNGEDDMPSPIDIEDYRGTLPTDIASIVSVREYENKYPMIESSSSFPPTYENNNLNSDVDPSLLQYTINESYIFTNFEEGQVELSYKAFMTDDDGMPLIINDEKNIKAIVAYCATEIARAMWLNDRLSENKFRYIEQQWLFYVNSARNSFAIRSLDHMESMKNSLTRLIRNGNHHSFQFNYRNYPEQIKIQ